ncbi:estrogen receptor beta isoform X1 [Ornithorhynchus anatinus]|uniref:Estrogen receptor beta n=1 Tax=Ornithorhynchus anatinus TaxID=9258 RepID=F7F1J6_ORNAN|nr:estrogen receptor beta isoform X1 [Ornithorhynchus anatinus]
MSLCGSSQRELAQLQPIQDTRQNPAEIKTSPSRVDCPAPYGCGRSSGPPEHSPLYIPPPYSESHHGCSTTAFYSPIVMSFNTASSGSDLDGGTVRPAASPGISWPTPGHVSPLPLHCPSSLIYAESQRSSWCEARLTEPVLPLPKLEMLKKKVNVNSCTSPASTASSPDPKRDAHFCAVCRDYASGYHYGVWSCEGCKAFFKRSIQGQNNYICPATNQCTIDKNRRKSCQSCRLRRCYEVGMMKCGSRRERCGHRAVGRRQDPQQPPPGPGKAGKSSESTATRVKELILSVLSPEQFVLTLLDAEPPRVSASRPSRPFTETSMMMSLTKLADEELVHMIGWAKKIPGFVELSLYEQVRLLESCWMEVLMVGLMWRSIDHPGKLIFAPDLILDRDEGKCVEGILEIFDVLLAMTSRLRELKLQHKEYLCVKAMILLNSTPDEPESGRKLHLLLGAVTDALMWVIEKSGIPCAQQSSRLAHLLLLLSHVRHASNKGMEHLLSMKSKNIVPVYDLLLEMLNAHTWRGPRKPPLPAPARGSPAPGRERRGSPEEPISQ